MSGFSGCGMIGPVSQPGPPRQSSRAERIRLARDDDGRVVLLRAIQLVGELIVQPDAVELAGHLVQLRRPRAAAVERHVGAAIVRLNHDVAVLRIDPDVVIVAVRCAQQRERLAAVGRFEEALRPGIDDVRIGRIGAERGVVERPLNQGRLANSPASTSARHHPIDRARHREAPRRARRSDRAWHW